MQFCVPELQTQIDTRMITDRRLIRRQSDPKNPLLGRDHLSTRICNHSELAFGVKQ